MFQLPVLVLEVSEDCMDDPDGLSCRVCWVYLMDGRCVGMVLIPLEVLNAAQQ